MKVEGTNQVTLDDLVGIMLVEDEADDILWQIMLLFSQENHPELQTKKQIPCSKNSKI